MAALLLRGRWAARLVTSASVRCELRALSSTTRGVQLTEPQQRVQKLEDELEQMIDEKLHAPPAPRLRSAPPAPPVTHRESWAPAAHVSEQPAENILHFTARMYIDASGKQPEWANKVEMSVKLSQLGLSDTEQQRKYYADQPDGPRDECPLLAQ